MSFLHAGYAAIFFAADYCCHYCHYFSFIRQRDISPSRYCRWCLFLFARCHFRHAAFQMMLFRWYWCRFIDYFFLFISLRFDAVTTFSAFIASPWDADSRLVADFLLHYGYAAAIISLRRRQLLSFSIYCRWYWCRFFDARYFSYAISSYCYDTPCFSRYILFHYADTPANICRCCCFFIAYWWLRLPLFAAADVSFRHIFAASIYQDITIAAWCLSRYWCRHYAISPILPPFSSFSSFHIIIYPLFFAFFFAITPLMFRCHWLRRFFAIVDEAWLSPLLLPPYDDITLIIAFISIFWLLMSLFSSLHW